MRFSRILAFIVLTIAAAALIAGCNNFFTSGDSVTTLTLSPVSRLAAVGDTVNYTASGTTVNGDTKDITSTATWTSSAPNVATIDSTGKATAVAAGTTTITAKQDDGSNTGSLLVASTDLTSIAVTPSSPTVALSTGTQQFKATGTFSDGSTQDLSSFVQWTSGTTSVATISKTGLASLLTAGSTQITASVTTGSTGSSTVSGNTQLTVQ